MSIRARIILAALAVVAAVTVASVAYTVDRERREAVASLYDTIREDHRLLQIVTSGPLYDGNIAQLNAILDSMFANPDMLEINLKETRGDIAFARKRAAAAQRGERIERQVRVLRGADELGTIRLAYTTANIEQRLAESRNTVVLSSLLLMGILSLVIYALASRLTRPIEQLTRAAREIAAGDLERSIEAKSPGELAILGQSFIQMRDAVRDKMADLADKNRQLQEQIEERARTEDALRASEERFAKMFREAPELMTLVRAADGRFLDVNHEFEKQTGFTRAEAIGRTAVDLGVWQSVAQREEMARALRKNGRVDEWEYQLKRRDGTLRHTLLDAVTVDLAGEPCWLFIIRDITVRVRAEQALRESDERLRQAVRVADIGIFDHDQIAGTIYWSPEQRRIYGLGPDEVVTLQGFLDHVYPGDRGRIGEAVARAHDPSGDGLFDVEHRIVRADGSVRWIATRSQTLFEGEGRSRRPVRTIGAVLDVTERRNAEEMRALLAAVVETSSDAIIVSHPEMDIVSWNSAAERMFGWSAAEIVGRGHSLIVPPELRHEPQTNTRLLVQGKAPPTFETVRVTKDGRRLHVQVSLSGIYGEDGGLKLVAGIFRDITERKAAEDALRESEARISEAYATLNDAIESAPAAIAIYDAEDRLIAFNSRFQAFFAFDPELVRPGVEFATLVRRFTESGQVARPQRTDAGWLEVRTRAHRDPSGPIEMELAGGRWLQITETRTRSGGMVTVYSDISMLKGREAELRRLNEELERKVAERTADLAAANKELEAFVYSVSHDLRAPLRGIDGFSHVLVAQHAAQLDPEARQLLERVRAAAQRMGRLIADLLDLSRLARSAVRRTDVDLSELARGVIDELGGEAAGRAVAWRVEPGMRVRGDPGLIRIVLVNLLGNALKYTRDSSPARIELGIAQRRGQFAEFFVRDNGAGFDMAYAARLFQPFQRLHAQHEFEGTGIGLATVQRVIAKHGGEIRGEGRPGAGATFYFTLPAQPTFGEADA